MNLRLHVHNILLRTLTTPSDAVPLGKECVWNASLQEIKERAFVVSAGAGKDISFELDLVAKTGCRLVLLDPSPTGIRTVEQTPLPANLFFEKKALSRMTGPILMARPKIAEEGSWRICLDGNGDEMESTCLSELMKKYGSSKIDLLKIDIEGYEYEVLKDIISKKLPVRQICAEIHEGRQFGKSKIKKWCLIFLLILSGFRLISWKGADYTFLRNST